MGNYPFGPPSGGGSPKNTLAWLNVVGYGADPAGVNDSTTAIQTAWNAAQAAGAGVVYIPAGTYKTTTTIGGNVNGAGVVIFMDPGATISYHGTGDCIRLYDSSSYGSREFGNISGIYGWGIIDGANTGASAASTGLHLGDIFQPGIYCTIQNFANHSGSINLHLDNQYYWTEQIRADVYLINAPQLCVFDQTPAGGSSGGQSVTGSFDRAEMLIRVDATYMQDLVVFANGTSVIDGSLEIRGNTTAGASTTTAAMLRLTGSSPAGSDDTTTFSYLSTSRLDIGVECDGNGETHGPYTIWLDTPGGVADNANYIFDCYGILSFDAFNSAVLQPNNGGTIVYFGLINGDTSFGASTDTPLTFNASFNATDGGQFSGGCIVDDSLIFQHAGTPGASTGYPQVYAKNTSYFMGYVAGNAGDQDPYDLGRVTRFLTGPAAITSTTPAPITDGTNTLSKAVGATTYRIRALIPYSSAVAAGTPVLAFTGPATSLCAFTSWFQNSTTTLIPAANNTTITATMTGPMLTAASDMVARIEGIVTFAAEGTLALTAKEGTASDAWTVLAGAYLELEPVG